MCFSARASFSAAVVLTGIGVVALGKAKSGPQKVVAAMPLLFAAQQCSEGVLWLSLMHPEYAHLKRASMYCFLFFAEMVWPLYMPFISILAEDNAERRARIRKLLALGGAIVATLLYGMMAWPVNAELREGHIMYDLQFPLVNYWYYGLIYFLPTIVAPLLTGMKMFRVLGISLLCAYVLSRLFYNHYVISIWCYCGALLSIIAIAIIREMAQGRSPGYETSKISPNS